MLFRSRHLVQRNSEEPLPEISTSVDPKSDPDYSSWGEEPAALNYIGLIAYLVKANNELHERVKVLDNELHYFKNNVYNKNESNKITNKLINIISNHNHNNIYYTKIELNEILAS